MNEVVIREITLPRTINGVTVVDDEGDYNVYINSRLSASEQHRALLHELRHINRGDFESFEDIDELEKDMP